MTRTEKPMALRQIRLVPGKSMDEIDRESYRAGPSPSDGAFAFHTPTRTTGA